MAVHFVQCNEAGFITHIFTNPDVDIVDFQKPEGMHIIPEHNVDYINRHITEIDVIG